MDGSPELDTLTLTVTGPFGTWLLPHWPKAAAHPCSWLVTTLLCFPRRSISGPAALFSSSLCSTSCSQHTFVTLPLKIRETWKGHPVPSYLCSYFYSWFFHPKTFLHHRTRPGGVAPASPVLWVSLAPNLDNFGTGSTGHILTTIGVTSCAPLFTVHWPVNSIVLDFPGFSDLLPISESAMLNSVSLLAWLSEKQGFREGPVTILIAVASSTLCG